MKPRGGSIIRYAAPVKAAAQRFAFLLLLALAVGLVVLGKADAVLVERLRTTVADAFAPILDALGSPMATIDETIADIRDLVHLRSENLRLKADNAHLREWEQRARELAAQNLALRETLKFVPHDEVRSVTARVIADSGGSFVRSLLVDAGTRDGVTKGQAAAAGEGLIGRIAEVGEISARVLLITDLNSRIPVMIESTRDHAILAGDNTDQPHLVYLPPNLNLSPGDRIVTASDGGAFPPGLPIGVVASASEGVVRVQPFVGSARARKASGQAMTARRP
jgi:rod shape-determining protein MreC